MPESSLTPSGQSFDEVWAVADRIPGWMTKAQAEMLDEQARRLPDGSAVLEIGSHQGRSTVMIGRVMQAKGGRVYAVDPFIDGKLFGGRKTRDSFEAHIAEAGVTDTVELVCDYSTKIRTSWDRPFQMLYIDGKHDYWTYSDDLKWRVHLPEGAPVLVHDCFSSIGVTLGTLLHVLPAKDLRYERRAGSMALFRVGKPTRADRMRILAEMPWWIRNVLVKVLLRLRLRPVAKIVFKHDSPYDPY
ncbi:class I SAM-dependent methyltransferase [Candidatus Blastococcus massiliensis]|uniref:class I SAM-dependent methyltransferase n=1 Tax=Candidatus Blastococcus massiliensis TaxID=1470358 RepID=UPI0004AEFB67|nr:class I SAM-dependent methyltransferase [Candidatus Blastococcus massiliensis]